jgi:hypothetical protein
MSEVFADPEAINEQQQAGNRSLLRTNLRQCSHLGLSCSVVNLTE